MNRKTQNRIGILALLLLILMVSLPGAVCQNKSETSLLISAAASLKAPLTEIQQLYTRKNPEVKLTINFGSSGALRQQIESGAPVDLFISAASREMDALQTKQLILAETRKDLLRNKIVLIVSKNGTWIKSFKNLCSDKLSQIALGKPETVPAGMYAQETLTYLKIWEQVKAKTVYAKDVKEVLTWVATGNIDAGIVYSTDAQIAPDVKVVAVAPEKSHTPIIYPAAVVKASLNIQQAKAFLYFLKSGKAKKVFTKFGFALK